MCVCVGGGGGGPLSGELPIKGVRSRVFHTRALNIITQNDKNVGGGNKTLGLMIQEDTI